MRDAREEVGGRADKRARPAAAESEAEARGNGRLAELGRQLRAGGAGLAGLAVGAEGEKAMGRKQGKGGGEEKEFFSFFQQFSKFIFNQILNSFGL